MLGGLGGAFVPLNIYVDESDAEQAAELLADVRAQNRATEVVDEDEEEASAEERAVAVANANRRHRLGVMLLFSFATAVTVPYTFDHPALGGVLIGGFFAVALWLMRAGSAKPPELPKARIHK
jgi:hypothetical protein